MTKYKLLSVKNVSTYLAAETARILAVLGDFHLFDHFTQRSTITGSIFTGDSDLLGAFCLKLHEKTALDNKHNL